MVLGRRSGSEANWEPTVPGPRPTARWVKDISNSTSEVTAPAALDLQSCRLGKGVGFLLLQLSYATVVLIGGVLVSQDSAQAPRGRATRRRGC